MTPVSAATDRAEDIRFFSEHPERNHRIGSRWIVRHRGSVFLRTPLPASHHYLDAEAEFAWWQCSWPELTPEARTEMAKNARRRSFSGRKRT